MTARDEELVGNAAARAYGEISAAALSFVPGEFTLPDTTRRFARAGIMRERLGYIVKYRGEPICALIEDRADPGINFTCILNATWVILSDRIWIRRARQLREDSPRRSVRPRQPGSGSC
ncbi:MAG: hypothetical protein IPK60_08705 [Sandaracinaceae bacterium]|nr:hypothetical protein [Sandaracinaceae bacterium]